MARTSVRAAAAVARQKIKSNVKTESMSEFFDSESEQSSNASTLVKRKNPATTFVPADSSLPARKRRMHAKPDEEVQLASKSSTDSWIFEFFSEEKSLLNCSNNSSNIARSPGVYFSLESKDVATSMDFKDSLELTSLARVLFPKSVSGSGRPLTYQRNLTSTERDHREHQRRRSLRSISSTGPMYFSRHTHYRVSLSKTPEMSPIRCGRLSFTPFANLPSTPLTYYKRLSATRTTTKAMFRFH